MIEWIQTATIVLIVIGNVYQLKNFRLMDSRLKDLELHLMYERENNGKGKDL